MSTPFTFVNYDKISDNLLWLGYTGNRESVNLKFVVDLVKQDQYGNERHFHSESKFFSKKFNRNSQSINRSYSCYFVINSGFENLGCVLRPSDIQILNMLIDNNIMKWFIGDTRIFKMDNNIMRVVGEYNPVTLPLSERSYLRFSPIIINYEESNSFKEGIRLEINSKDVCCDITLDKFMDFVYIIKNTDMITLAATMINYVKIPPYNVNIYNGSSYDNNGGGSLNGMKSNGKSGNFFDK